MSLRFVRYPDRESWLAARRLSIGSSDAPAIMGESSWASPFTLNLHKRGVLPETPPDECREADLDWHRTRESEISRWWWERLQVKADHLLWKRQGVEVFPWDPGDFTVAYREVDGVPLSATFDRLLILRNSETSNALAVLDAVDRDADLSPGLRAHIDAAEATLYRNVAAVVELKNVREWMAKHWQEEPPLIYQLQLQHQLLVADVRPGYLVASIGGQPPVWAEVLRDGGITSILRANYRKFWASVVGNYDLPADHHEVTSKAITVRHPNANADTVQLDTSVARWWRTRVSAANTIADHKKTYDEATNSLKQAIGDASYGLLPDGTTLSLIPNKRGQRNLRVVGEDNGSPEDF